MSGKQQTGGEGKPFDLKQRTKQFALRTMRLADALPKSDACRTIGWQLLRSSTSVGANCRAAHRGRSKAEFLAKMGIVEEELDESSYWLELLVESGAMPEARLRPLMDEANELTAIVVSCIKRARIGRA
jgi:four helix bundle protein